MALLLSFALTRQTVSIPYIGKVEIYTTQIIAVDPIVSIPYIGKVVVDIIWAMLNSVELECFNSLYR